jgi:hypothetical protein
MPTPDCSPVSRRKLGRRLAGSDHGPIDTRRSRPDFIDPDESACLFTDVSGQDARQITEIGAVRRGQDRFDQLSKASLSRSESMASLRDLIRVTVGPYHSSGWGW